MKKISLFLKSIFSLGVLGLIILLMAGLLLAAGVLQLASPLVDSIGQILLIDAFENVLGYQLGELQIQEGYTLFYLEYGFDADETVALAAEADAFIDDLFLQMEDDDAFFGIFAEEEISQMVDDFNQLRKEHRQTFARLVEAYASGDDPVPLITQLQEENMALKYTLHQITILLKQGWLDIQSELPASLNVLILLISAMLVVLLFTGLAGYLLVSARLRPINQLTNAITAIGGDRYQDEMLATLANRHDAAGRLARALAAFAHHLEEKTAGQKEEVRQLRQALFESRRRRLKVSHDDIADGGSK